MNELINVTMTVRISDELSFNESSTTDSLLIDKKSFDYFGLNVTDETFVPVYNFTEVPTTLPEQNIVPKSTSSVFESGLIIPLYVAIFILSVVGNSLVAITLAQNKRMRTVTNVYLLNLVSNERKFLLA